MNKILQHLDKPMIGSAMLETVLAPHTTERGLARILKEVGFSYAEYSRHTTHSIQLLFQAVAAADDYVGYIKIYDTTEGDNFTYVGKVPVCFDSSCQKIFPSSLLYEA